jgi:hypothetical protein
MTMKKAFLIGLLILLPVPTLAATLTQVQVDAIVQVLMAFGVDQQTILLVEQSLAPVAPETSISQPPITFGSVTEPEAKIPTSISLSPYIVGGTMWGGMCGQAQFTYQVLDQDGTAITCSPIEIFNGISTTTINHDGTKSGTFLYSSPNFDTTDTLTVSCGFATGTYSLPIKSSLGAAFTEQDFTKQDATHWIFSANGMSYNPQTATCY